MYTHITVPLDGSRFAEAALPLALTLSRKTGASLHFVTVVEPIPAFSTEDFDDWQDSARTWSDQYLAQIRERVSPLAGGVVSTAVVTGHAAEVIQAEAARTNSDLVVMASHGRGPFTRLWLGSVADRFVRHADRPIVVVRPDEADVPTLDSEPRFETLFVPLDGSDLSEFALSHATTFGELFGSAYHLTRVVSYPLDLASPYLPHTAQMNQDLVEEAKVHAAAYLEEQANRMRKKGLRVTTSVAVDAQAGQGILREAQEVGCDMIAMATHGRTGLSRALLGSAADKVLRGSHAPLLLYRPKG